MIGRVMQTPEGPLVYRSVGRDQAPNLPDPAVLVDADTVSRYSALLEIDRAGFGPTIDVTRCTMARVCPITGKKTTFGNTISRRGKAKYLGGIGRKTTGISRRKFKPNIQKVRAFIDGRVVRIRVSAAAIRLGTLVKPPKRVNPKAESKPE